MIGNGLKIETLKEKLGGLAQYRKIVVTGPQRSGTHITARILADIFNIEYIEERTFGFKSFFKMKVLLVTKAHYSIQAPAVMHKVWELSNDIAIVVCVRKLKDIIASQNKIGWTRRFARLEKNKFKDIDGLDMDQCVARVKYDYAEKMKDDRTFFVKREILVEHPLWVPAEQRTNFRLKQTHI